MEKMTKKEERAQIEFVNKCIRLGIGDITEEDEMDMRENHFI